ncbi:uncharacterized protein ATNIH1004_005324 [Aspergillus tanneri]|uniref:Retrotransposon gag domain-containing protein n=1 Tax=Aspergillus tanneri TaxID=1220188 RepID=A0A5M9MQ28_9EURO|nr:uncharacterized protein ATNIH1004_005324 [Aspergillus tanneri]KAA8646649.1 hypothetical protein ATNIH1004_005324 [Aspergillus tanneri]
MAEAQATLKASYDMESKHKKLDRNNDEVRPLNRIANNSFTPNLSSPSNASMDDAQEEIEFNTADFRALLEEVRNSREQIRRLEQMTMGHGQRMDGYSDPVGGISRETKEASRKMSDLSVIPMYGGKYAKDAACKWLIVLEDYFENKQQITKKEATDLDKITIASQRLTGLARDRWYSAREQARSDPTCRITSFEQFKEWIELNFGEILSDTRRWEEYEACTQGTRLVQSYGTALRTAADRVKEDIPEPMLIRKFVTGAKPALQAMWARDINQPLSWR